MFYGAVAGKLLEGEPQKWPPRHPLPSVVKAVANLGVDFAGIEEMGSAEGETVVEEDATVGDVDGVDVDGEAFAKTFTEGQVEGGVPGQVRGVTRGGVAVGEAGGVRDVGGGVAVPWQGEIAADVEGVALVVVEKAEAITEGEVSEAAVDIAEAKGELIRIG
jgi:hypothetical protein